MRPLDVLIYGGGVGSPIVCACLPAELRPFPTKTELCRGSFLPTHRPVHSLDCPISPPLLSGHDCALACALEQAHNCFVQIDDERLLFGGHLTDQVVQPLPAREGLAGFKFQQTKTKNTTPKNSDFDPKSMPILSPHCGLKMGTFFGPT